MQEPATPDPAAPRPSDEQLWTRDFVLAAGVNFFLALVFYLLMTSMALYAADRFGAADSAAGLAASMFVIGATAARLLAGRLVDVAGRKRVLLVAIGVFVLASASYFAAGSLPLLLGVRFVHGAAFGTASTAAIAIAQSLIPQRRRAEGTGFFTLSTTLATAVGPFVALLLVDGPGYDALFAAAVVAAGLGMVVALILRVPEPVPDAQLPSVPRRFRLGQILEPSVLPLAAFMLVIGAGYSGVLTFLNAFAQGLDLTAGASAFFLAYAAVIFASRFVVGRLQDVRGDNVVVYPAIASFTAGLLVLASARTVGALVVAGALVGLGFGTLMAAGQAIVVSLVPPHRVGVAVSTYFFVVDTGVGLGPVLLGLLVQGTGHRTMYVVLAGVVALTAGLYHLVHGRTPRDPARTAGPAGAPVVVVPDAT